MNDASSNIGPDAIRNQNVTILNPTYIGIGTMSPEGTSNVDYLWRPGRVSATKYCRETPFL